MNEYVLLDGALARGVLDCQALLLQSGVWTIYEDLGVGAAAVGPILTTVPLRELITIDTLASANVPERRAWGYAHALLRASCDASTVAAHLRQSRYLQTRDGQRFYFRYADARCLLAMWPALNEPQRSTLLGPIEKWTVRSAAGQTVSLSGTPGTRNSTIPLTLSDAALESLTRAMWSWNLLGAAEEADASISQRDSDAPALQWCDRATVIANEAPKSGFAVETMLAVALIQSDGQAESNPTFHDALQRARQTNDTHEIQRWIDARTVAEAKQP